MSQGHRRHGGGGYTLLYYIGLEGKEDRRTEGQKNRKKKINGTEDRRTKTGGKGNRSKGEKGQKATTEAAQSGDWKVVAYLESVAE